MAGARRQFQSRERADLPQRVLDRFSARRIHASEKSGFPEWSRRKSSSPRAVSIALGEVSGGAGARQHEFRRARGRKARSEEKWAGHGAKADFLGHWGHPGRRRGPAAARPLFSGPSRRPFMKSLKLRLYLLSSGGLTFAFLSDAMADLPLSSIFATFLTQLFTQFVLGFLQLLLPGLAV
jgi:hypothetical protein